MQLSDMMSSMSFSPEDVAEYKATQENQGRKLSDEDAAEELRRVRHLLWILGHRLPLPGEEPYDPPPPPWL
jgi:hypothetical protein